MKKFLFISWAPHSSRSDAFAYHFNGISKMIYSNFLSTHILLIPIKYFVFSFRTIRVLWTYKPRYIMVMVPPVIACIPIWLYCICTKSTFAIDAHTAAILMKRWQKVFFIQRFFSKMAAVTIVTNTHLEKKIKEKKTNIIIIRDIPIIEAVLPHNKSLDVSKILVVCSFQSNDEPIIEILVAASKFPSINFYITGDHSKVSNTIRHSRPPNVHFTGFLSREKYISHMQTSCIIIALTTRNFTMQRGAYEAIYLGKPVITSNFPLLIESFYKGTIHVSPDAKGIQNGINMALEKVEELTDQAIELKMEKIKIWENNKSNLSRLLMHP